MNHISARRNSSTFRSWARLRVEGKERPKDAKLLLLLCCQREGGKLKSPSK